MHLVDQGHVYQGIQFKQLHLLWNLQKTHDAAYVMHNWRETNATTFDMRSEWYEYIRS